MLCNNAANVLSTLVFYKSTFCEEVEFPAIFIWNKLVDNDTLLFSSDDQSVNPTVPD